MRDSLDDSDAETPRKSTEERIKIRSSVARAIIYFPDDETLDMELLPEANGWAEIWRLWPVPFALVYQLTIGGESAGKTYYRYRFARGLSAQHIANVNVKTRERMAP